MLVTLESWLGLRHTPVMLEVKNLSLAVPTSQGAAMAVSDVSFSLHPGRVLGLVGESGCGKTLTAQAILRLGDHQGIARVSGKVLLDNEDVFAMGDIPLRRIRGGRIAMVFQEPMTALNPVFTIGSQMTEVIRLHLKLDKESSRTRAVKLLSDVGLSDAQGLLSRYPDELSGGMRQRVLIAMAMSADPDYIIADEPTTALDVSVQKRIIRLLRDLQSERGLGMLLVTHDFGLVAELADDVAVMYAGEIVETGSVAQIFDQPAHPYTRALMGCRPGVSEPGSPLPVIAGNVPSPGRWPSGCRFAPRCHWASDACNEKVDKDSWKKEAHHARCVRVADIISEELST